MHEEFEDFWLDIVDYAQELDLPSTYIEEEFLIEGELIKVDDPRQGRRTRKRKQNR